MAQKSKGREIFDGIVGFGMMGIIGWGVWSAWPYLGGDDSVEQPAVAGVSSSPPKPVQAPAAESPDPLQAFKELAARGAATPPVEKSPEEAARDELTLRRLLYAEFYVEAVWAVAYCEGVSLDRGLHNAQVFSLGYDPLNYATTVEMRNSSLGKIAAMDRAAQRLGLGAYCAELVGRFLGPDPGELRPALLLAD